MRRLAGTALVAIGLVPVLAAIWGIATDAKAVAVLAIFAFADLSLLVGGSYLLIRSN